jgi:hypothetical protein
VKCNGNQFLVIINKFGACLTQDQIAEAGLTNEFETDAGRVYLPSDVFLTTGHSAEEVLERVSEALSLDFLRALMVVTKFDELVYRGLIPTTFPKIPRSVGKPSDYREMVGTNLSMTPKQAEELEASISKEMTDDTAQVNDVVCQLVSLSVEDLHEQLRRELAT